MCFLFFIGTFQNRLRILCVKADNQINGSGALDYYLAEMSYEEWLKKVQADMDMANILPGRVPALTYFYVREEDDQILGMINLRLSLNDFQRTEGGHIGYCVRPTERRKHYAREMLKEASQRGIVWMKKRHWVAQDYCMLCLRT